ncbi:putative transposase-like DNA-binding protein [Kitasatospora cineracea]|uniref:Putative transposase-like DNA-binding protein n=1 Tax=Kitasatospora cineracea TaxID=88074 RepID=A0A8G1U9Q4_9ACTN|nr:putative transposase-like DNA-binding protein [Kitasatospora cineracea]
MVLRQSLRDSDAAYGNFFDGLKGKRPRTGPPRYKSRKAARQSIRFTANASWRYHSGREAAPAEDRRRARAPVARAADARREFHHRLSTKLIRENQAVAVEDLAVKGLARTRPAKSVHDAGWSAFVSMFEYEAARYGRTFVRIGRFEPTSPVCSVRGVKDGPEPLDVREWTCEVCGAVLDRDVNAAVNVARAAGLAVPACGAQVGPVPVPAQRGEAGTRRDPQARVVGIPLLQSREEVNATATASPPAPPAPPTAPAATSASASPADACRPPAGHPPSPRQHLPNTGR